MNEKNQIDHLIDGLQQMNKYIESQESLALDNNNQIFNMVCRLVVENFASNNKITPLINSNTINQKEIKESHNSEKD